MSDISFEVNGRTYPFVAPSEASLGEARELKRLSGGMGLASLEAALADVDPDAWTAVMLISIRRVDPTAKDGVLDDENLASVIGAMSEALEDAKSGDADAVPPTPAVLPDPALSNGATMLEVAGT